jgi:hypothetical protein
MIRVLCLLSSLSSVALTVGCPASPPAVPDELAAQDEAASAAAPDAVPSEVSATGGELPLGDPGVPAPPTTFTDLIAKGDGRTVTISGAVTGAKNGQIDFVAAVQREGRLVQEHLQSARFKNGRYSLEVPATYEHPIVVTAVVMEEGEQPGPSVPSGACANTVKLSGHDVTCDITIGEHDDPSEFFPLDPVLDPALRTDGRAPGVGPATGPADLPPVTAPGSVPALDSAPAPAGGAPAPAGGQG